MIDQLADYSRMLAGAACRFDEPLIRDLLRREVTRAHNFAARQNHDLLSAGEIPDGPLSSINAPTIVIHGTADPLFPIEHGAALAREIPGARLLPLPGAGHGVYQADLGTIASAVIEHTNACATRHT